MCEAINYQPLTSPEANAKTLAINIGPHLGYVSPTKRRKGEVVSCEEKILPFPRVFRRSHVKNNPIVRYDPYGLDWVDIDPNKQSECQKKLTQKGDEKIVEALLDGKDVPSKIQKTCKGGRSLFGKINTECKTKDKFKKASEEAKKRKKKEEEKKKKIDQMKKYCPTCNFSAFD